MNYVSEAIQFVLLVVILTTLFMTGIKWTEYPWHLAVICVALVLYNIAAYKQGNERGAEIARSACTTAIAEMFDNINKKL